MLYIPIFIGSAIQGACLYEGELAIGRHSFHLPSLSPLPPFTNEEAPKVLKDILCSEGLAGSCSWVLSEFSFTFSLEMEQTTI